MTIAYWISLAILWVCIIMNAVVIRRNLKIRIKLAETLCEQMETLSEIHELRKRWEDRSQEVSGPIKG